MKQEVFNSERAEIAAFAPYAVIGEIDGALVMDIPVQATDRSSTYQFRAVWDETDDGEVAGIRVYALAPNYKEIKTALLECRVQEEQVDMLFTQDSAGNHLMETCGAKNGGLALAYATAYLTLVSQLAEKGQINRLIENRGNWACLLPIFGVNSCGYRIARSSAAAAPRAEEAS